MTTTHKPFKDVLAKRTSRNFEYTDPIYLRKLAEHAGSHAGGGALIGISAALVSDSLKQNRTRTVNEIAAKGVYEKLNGKGDDAKETIGIAIVSGRKEDLAFIKRAMQTTGGKFTYVADA